MNQTCSNCDQLAARIAALVEAMQDMSYSSGGARNRYCRCCQSRIGDAHVETCWVRALLSATPADALDAYRRKVLEEVETAAMEKANRISLKSSVTKAANELRVFAQDIRRMAGETVAKTVAKEDESKGFEGINQ